MTTRWREEWEVFRRAAPGHRFRERFERMRAVARPRHERIARFLCGLVVILVGIVLIPLPGPGWLIVGFGLTLMAQESLHIAEFCDVVEVRFRGLARRWRARRARDDPARRP